MADNVLITAGTGTTIAADEVSDGVLGSCKVQYVKIMDGTLDGTSKLTISANGLYSDVRNIQTGDNVIGRVKLTDGTEVASIDSSNRLEVAVGNTVTVSGTITAALTSADNTVGRVKLTDGTDVASITASGYLEVSVANTVAVSGSVTATLGIGDNTAGRFKLTDGVEVASVDASNRLEVSVGNTVSVNVGSISAGENHFGQVGSPETWNVHEVLRAEKLKVRSLNGL